MLTLSLVMIPGDWIGIVTIRNETRRMRCANGTTKITPGPRGSSFTFPRLKPTARSYCLMMYAAIMALRFLDAAGGRQSSVAAFVVATQLAAWRTGSHPGDALVHPPCVFAPRAPEEHG